MTCHGCAGSLTHRTPVCLTWRWVHVIEAPLALPGGWVREGWRMSTARVIPATATPAEAAILFTVLGYRLMEGVNA